MGHTQVSRAEVERAITTVRLVLAVMSSVVVLGVAATRSRSIGELIPQILPVLPIVIGAAVTTLGWRRLGGSDHKPWGARNLAVHAFDTCWFVGVTIALGAVTPAGAWVIMVLPAVVASLRLDDRAVLSTWVLTTLVYLGGWELAPERVQAGPQALVERLGLLLAVAASLALLTRWLQAGWIVQGIQAEEADRRSRRLALVEASGREMRSVTSESVIDLCLAAVVRLGFGTATASDSRGRLVRAAGDGGMVPQDAKVEGRQPTEQIEITHWTNSTTMLQSVSLLEPRSGWVITGWATEQVEEGLAETMADLVANATNALDAALHLERARYDATHDQLTGMANRSELLRQLEVASRSADALAVIFVDLDHFKPINDTHGHLVGDRVLAAVGKRIIELGSGEVLAARYGGDEFAVLLRGRLTEITVDLAEDIRRSLADPFDVDGLELTVSASLGVATGTGSPDFAEILRQADHAAYQAKHHGRNRVFVARRDDEIERSGTPSPRSADTATGIK